MARTSADKIGTGLVAPLRRSGSDFESGTGSVLIKSNIRQVLGVKAASQDGAFLGEYPHRLEFGAQIYRLRHANIRGVKENLSVVFAARAVATWEPRAFVDTEKSKYLPPSGTDITGTRSRQLRVAFGLENDVTGRAVDRTSAQSVDTEVSA